jgi:hypothetical protein
MVFKEARADSLTAVALLTYSLVCGYGLYLDLTAWPIERLHRWSARLFILLIALAILEILTPLKDIVRAFSYSLGETVDYRSLLVRDEALHGGYRPSVFSSEASHLAITLSLCQIVWSMTAQRLDARSLAFLIASSIVSLTVVRSPLTALPILTLAGLFVFGLRKSERVRKSGATARLIGAGIVSVALLAALAILFNRVFSARLLTILSGSDWSTTVRTYGAFDASWTVARQHPFFGVGVSNFEYVRSTVLQVYLDRGVPFAIVDSNALKNLIGTNGLTPPLIYFGFAGTAAYLYLWDWITRFLAPLAPAPMRWVLFWIVCLMSGSIYAPSYVWPLIALMATLKLASQSQAAAIRGQQKRVPGRAARSPSDDDRLNPPRTPWPIPLGNT